jgi:hypothetical protein
LVARDTITLFSARVLDDEIPAPAVTIADSKGIFTPVSLGSEAIFWRRDM